MRAARVGEQRAVVWKLVYRNPAWATRSKVGVEIGPPNVLDAPKPTSSVRMSKIFGAPFGGCTSLGKSGTESLALRPMRPLNGGSGLGSVSCASTGNQPILDIAAPTNNATQARENTETTDVTFIVPFLSTRAGSPNCVHECLHTCASGLNQISKEVETRAAANYSIGFAGNTWRCFVGAVL